MVSLGCAPLFRDGRAADHRLPLLSRWVAELSMTGPAMLTRGAFPTGHDGSVELPAVRAPFFWLALGHLEMEVQGQYASLLICLGVQALLELQLRFFHVCEAQVLRSARLMGSGVKRPGWCMTGVAMPVLLFGNPESWASRLRLKDGKMYRMTMSTGGSIDKCQFQCLSRT